MSEQADHALIQRAGPVTEMWVQRMRETTDLARSRRILRHIRRIWRCVKRAEVRLAR